MEGWHGMVRAAVCAVALCATTSTAQYYADNVMKMKKSTVKGTHFGPTNDHEGLPEDWIPESQTHAQNMIFCKTAYFSSSSNRNRKDTLQN